MNKKNYYGGILSYGIPEFRLPLEKTQKLVQSILNLGIQAKTKCKLGKDITLDQLKEQYDAIFLAMGANISAKMNIKGENLPGVFGANELLRTKKHPSYKEKKIAIIGGGNVAIDIARTVKRMGANKAIVVYRRNEEQMPAEAKEIEMAKEDGVEFAFQTNIIEIQGNENVEKVTCIKTELIQKEGESRAYPVNIERN